MTRVCTFCNQEKPFGEFHKASKCGRLRGDCKSCNNRHREKRYRKLMALNPEARRLVILKNKYGISEAEYIELFTSQKGVCKICKHPETALKKVLSVDHCHTTGKVRGLLCHSCNVGIGFLKEDKDILKNAIEYLEVIG